MLFLVLWFFKACGLALLVAGFLLFIDSKRILLSRLVGATSETLLNLPHPFFYYIALGLAVAGLFAIFASFLGWWASCLNSYCVLSIVCGSFKVYFKEIDDKLNYAPISTLFSLQIMNFRLILVFFSRTIVIACWIYILLNGNSLATMPWIELGRTDDGESVAVQLRSARKRAGDWISTKCAIEIN